MSCWWRASCSQRTEWPWQRGRPSCCPSGCPELRPLLAAGRGSGVAEGTERTGRRESGTGVQGSAGMTAACSQGIWRGEKPGTGRQPPAGEAQPGLSSCCGLRAAGSPPRRDAPLSAFLSEPRLFLLPLPSYSPRLPHSQPRYHMVLTPHPRPRPPALLPQVVCARCSDYRAELKYDANRPNRVCLHCYTFLTGHVLPEDKEDKRRGILEVRAPSPVQPRAARLPRVGTVLGAARLATFSLLPLPTTPPPAPPPAACTPHRKAALGPGCRPGPATFPVSPSSDPVTAQPLPTVPAHAPADEESGGRGRWY